MRKSLPLLLYIFFLLTCIYSIFYDSYFKHINYYDKVAILTYHHIAPEESNYTISPERFRSHLQALKVNHYNVISVEDFIGFLQNKKRVPPNAVVITFDDGYESFYQYAYPELKKQKMTATNFLIVNNINNPFLKPSFLKWNEIIEMKKEGFSFYSHTFNSHSFVIDPNGKQVATLTNHLYKKSEHRMENEEEYKQRILNDLDMADRVLKEKLGNPINLLCFPYGIYSKEVIKLGEQVGIQYFFTGREGFNSRNEKEIKRITVGSPNITATVLLKKLKVPNLNKFQYFAHKY
jgi:poly-beta-1,6-N-acetyl-D-glucosamine N-deacetylase